MAKELMNEAERFLLKNWGEARMLEESIEGVRAKYKEVFQRIIEAVMEGHRELDIGVAYPTQFWGSGSIGFGRKSWPEGDAALPAGLWVDSLRLENLASEDSESPYASIWVSNKAAKRCNLDVTAARAQLTATADEHLSSDERAQIEQGDYSEVLLYLPAPSKAELLELLADGDGQKFVDRFVRQFDLLARFVPTLDKLLVSFP